MTKPASRKSTKRKSKKPKRPEFLGWHTSDEDEIERRRWRGITEVADFTPLEPEHGIFGTFEVQAASGATYAVEIRDLKQRANSCACRDFEVAGLGTCKHVEGVLNLLALSRNRMRSGTAGQRSPRIEIHVSFGDESGPVVSIPDETCDGRVLDEVESLVEKFRQQHDRESLAKLRQIEAEHPQQVRVSRLLERWRERQLARERPLRRREAFLSEVESGERTFDLLNFPLFPYQRDGVMHLAFTERALLADEMGLGKTCQTLAACELLKQIEGVQRALIVCPASLKAEWAEQIEAATTLPYRTVFGPRHERLEIYENPKFFTITNYEQILMDGAAIQKRLDPDIVILDEAQRIKNWRTKTANAVKQLHSRFAFVLTGTPIENRIDEIYSIVQFLDPNLLGPLFRFNRQYYRLDDRGRASGYQNLGALSEQVEQVMLRRRKVDVEDDLPGRTVNNYFVRMTDEQRVRYEDYENLVARIARIADTRPLTEEEFKRLQIALGCMRMVCDTPFILDDKVRDCPKLEELERILEEMMSDPDCKVLIFSEWVRMLSLVRELLNDCGIDYALHTGSVPQKRRKAEIKRFKEDPECRVFLSSESGGAGLNLQVANAVINLDQPWNPAKLEQRIARAWRKHQKRSVTVANLVSEKTIEHNMLFLLEQKKAVADAVLDGKFDSEDMDLPSGRAAFLQRLEEVMGAAIPKERAPEPEDQILSLLEEEYKDTLLLVEMRRSETGQQSLLAVVDPGKDRDIPEFRNSDGKIFVEVIDRETHDTMLRLQAAGLVKFASDSVDVLFQSSRPDPREEEAKRRKAEARSLLDSAERKFRMATLLAGGGFEEEANAQAEAIATLAIRSLSTAREEKDDAAQDSVLTACERLAAAGHLPQELLGKALWLCTSDGRADQSGIHQSPSTGTGEIESTSELLSYVRGAIGEGEASQTANQ